jgi:hypothetical protein
MWMDTGKIQSAFTQLQCGVHVADTSDQDITLGMHVAGAHEAEARRGESQQVASIAGDTLE